MSQASSSDSVFLENGFGENSIYSPVGMDRYARLLIYLENAAEDLSSGVSEELYAKYLGKLSIMKKSKSVPWKMYKKMKTTLKDNLLNEIKMTIQEEDIETNLHILQKLIDESKLQEGDKVWRPNGNVKDHMRSHLMEVKLNHRDKLEKVVREKEQDAECVLRKLCRLRTHVRSLESRLHELKSQCDDNSSVVDKVDRKILDKVEDLY